MANNSIKPILENTVDLPEVLKDKLEEEFQKNVYSTLTEALNINVEKPLELLITDPDFRRLVTAWDRKNPEVTRAQLLRSFPAAFRDLQGNTLAEPIVDFFMGILNALASDTSLMQRLIRALEKDKGVQTSAETGEEGPVTESFRFLRVIVENAEEYMEKEQYVLNAGYKFAFFANDELMPVSKEEATHKVFVKTITVEDEKEDSEFSFVAKKMVALEWKPEYGGVGVEEEKPSSEKESESEEEMSDVEGELPELPDDDEELEKDEENEELVNKLDEYLDYVVQEYFRENQIAIENGLKVELAENLLKGIKQVLTENNVEVVENALPKIQEYEKKIREYEDSLNSLYEKNISLFKENKSLQKALFEARKNQIVDSLIQESGIVDVKAEKVKKMISFVKFNGNENDQEIKEKVLSIIREGLVFEKTSTEEKPKMLFKESKIEQLETKKQENVEANLDKEIIEILKGLK